MAVCPRGPWKWGQGFSFCCRFCNLKIVQRIFFFPQFCYSSWSGWYGWPNFWKWPVGRRLVFGPCGLDIWVHSLQMVVPLGPYHLRFGTLTSSVYRLPVPWCVLKQFQLWHNIKQLDYIYILFISVYTCIIYIFISLGCLVVRVFILDTCFTWVERSHANPLNISFGNPGNKTGEMRTSYNSPRCKVIYHFDDVTLVIFGINVDYQSASWKFPPMHRFAPASSHLLARCREPGAKPVWDLNVKRPRIVVWRLDRFWHMRKMIHHGPMMPEAQHLEETSFDQASQHWHRVLLLLSDNFLAHKTGAKWCFGCFFLFFFPLTHFKDPWTFLAHGTFMNMTRWWLFKYFTCGSHPWEFFEKPEPPRLRSWIWGQLVLESMQMCRAQCFFSDHFLFVNDFGNNFGKKNMDDHLLYFFVIMDDHGKFWSLLIFLDQPCSIFHLKNKPSFLAVETMPGRSSERECLAGSWSCLSERWRSKYL